MLFDSGIWLCGPQCPIPTKIQPPAPHVPNLPCPCWNSCPCHLPPLPQNQIDSESTSSESSDSEDGDSLQISAPLKLLFF